MKRFLLAFLAFTLVAVPLIAGTAMSGKWQAIHESPQGRGSEWYQFNFDETGTVRVIKQYPGGELLENMKFSVGNDGIILLPGQSRTMTELDNALITEQSGESFKRIVTPAFSLRLTPFNIPVAVAHLVLILLVLLALNELFRRYKWPTVILYFAIPVLLIPLWIHSDISHWFRWVKLYSVVFAVIWFTLMRYTALNNYTFAKLVVALILCGNIAEAVAQDFSAGYLPNALNAIAGIFNILVLYRWRDIGRDKTRTKDLVWPSMTPMWIVAYFLWNWTFVYLNFPEHAAFHFMVLSACTIPAFIKPGVWIQARAFTLAAWMIYLFTFQIFIDSNVIGLPRSGALMTTVAGLSLAINLFYAVFHYRFYFLKKAPRWMQVGQSAIKSAKPAAVKKGKAVKAKKTTKRSKRK